MFNSREVDWSLYTHPTANASTVFVDTRNGDRRLLAQSPLPMDYMDVDYHGNGGGGHEFGEMQHQLPGEINFYQQAMSYLDSQPSVFAPPEASTMLLSDDDGSDGYNTPDEEFDDEDGAETVGVEPEEMTTTPERKIFSTPCGQTYWVDGDFYLYTNQTVDIPIGYWCNIDQCVYLDDGSEDTTDDEDEYDPPPTPPPMYEESESVQGSPVPMDTGTDSEVDGEVIVLGTL